MPNKLAYFQGGGGGNEPTPGKKKYKSDPAITVQPRFKEPFYRNYYLYTIPGMEDIGPGTGWHGLQNYNDVKSFLEDRRKHLKSRYVADDSWQLDNGKRVKARMAFLSRLVKTANKECSDSDVEYSDRRDAYMCSNCLHMSENCATDPKPTSKELHAKINHNEQHIDYRNDTNDSKNYDYGAGLYDNMDKYKSVSEFLDGKTSISQWRKKQDDNDIDFKLDEYTDPSVEEGIDEQADHNTNEIGGFLDDYLPEDDFEGKSPDKLDFGRDYEGEFTEPKDKVNNIEELIQMYLDFHAHRPPLELPDGIQEEEEGTEPNDPNGQYGETDSGNTFYDKMWI